LSSVLPLPLTANERRLHAVAYHLPLIPVLVTIELAIALAVSVIIAPTAKAFPINAHAN
jgi:hypothetical protein